MRHLLIATVPGSQNAPEMNSVLETVNGKCNDAKMGFWLQLLAKNATEKVR